MKKIFWLACLLPAFLGAQNYVDLVRIGYGETFSTEFDGVSGSTTVSSLDIFTTVPVPLSESQIFLTGIDLTRNRLQLQPDAAFSNLYSTTLKLGLASTFSEKWSSTVILLPKIASNYSSITSDDFFIGGFALAKLKKRESLIYRFGFYGSTEPFGFFATPIFGWYYLSDNGRFEMDVSLPIAADISYQLGVPTIGLDYFGIGRGYNIRQDGQPNTYAQQGALEFAGYVQVGILKNSVLLRAKAGYTSNDFELYAENDTYSLGLSAFRFGDDRDRLNPEMKGGGFFRIEAIYRFRLDKENATSTPE